jgi:hypothetical protein
MLYHVMFPGSSNVSSLLLALLDEREKDFNRNRTSYSQSKQYCIQETGVFLIH